MGTRPLILLLLILSFGRLFAQWTSVGNFDTYAVEGNRITVRAGMCTVEISLLAADLVRVRLAPRGSFGPDRSWAVVKTEWPVIRPEVRESTEEIRIATEELVLLVSKRPVRLAFFDRDGTLLHRHDPSRGMAWDGEAVRVWNEMPLHEYYYGFGEKAGRLNRKHTHMTMWNSDIPAYKADTDPLYKSIPFFYGIHRGVAYGIFFDNSYWSSFDMGKEFPDRFSFGAVGGELDYYFFYGPAPAKILSRFTELVGRMPLPPRWSLGYQQCRWSYYPESRVRKLANDFRSKKIPCDVIYLDIDYMDGYRIFTWSDRNFPDPKRMMAELARDGFKIAVIVDPGIKADSSYHAFVTGLEGDHFLKYPDGRLYIGKVWPGECAFPDFSKAAARDWWGENVAVLVDAGVKGFWNDMNEPSVFDVPTKTIDLDVIHDDGGLRTPHAKNHNLYGLQMTQATYEGARRLRPDERPFILTRASFAGGQRYSSAWTGDNIASWEHLEMAVPMLLNLSISGQPFIGTDIGGFVGSPDGELFARWLQLGVFSPLMRAHTVINSADQEPWSFGARYEKINRRIIELRYRLLPYIYNAMVRAAATGIPPLRPLAFDFPEDGTNAWNQTEFMFGDDMLVAPVLWPGATKRELRLPAGTWYDYWTRTKYEGGKRISLDAPVERIPFFIRAGAIVPLQQVVQYVDEAPINPLTLLVCPSPQSKSEYYEDDGISYAYESGGYFIRTIEQSSDARVTSLKLSEAAGSYRPPPRTLVVEFVDHQSTPKRVSIHGRAVRRADRVQTGGTEGWHFDGRKRVLTVWTPDTASELTITVER